MKKLWKLASRCLIAIIVVVGISAIFIVSQFNQPPFDMAKLKQLRSGMNKNTVRQILGEPTTIQHKQEWNYSRLLSWPIVYIYFDNKENFKEYRYDY